jgi:hypothetical protein
VGALRRFGVLLALGLSFAAGPCSAREAAAWRVHVGEAAARFGLPEDWVLRVIDAESGGRTHLGGRPITSHAGAMGLMQVMPATWASLRAQYRLGPDPHDPRDNIVAGTAYLRQMYDLFGYPGLFAAYNAGPGRYGEYLARGRPLPRETRDYVARITGTAPALPVPPRMAARVRESGADVGRAVKAVVRDPIFLARAPVPMPGERAMRRPDERRDRESGDTADPPVAVADPVFLLRKPGANRGE